MGAGCFPFFLPLSLLLHSPYAVRSTLCNSQHVAGFVITASFAVLVRDDARDEEVHVYITHRRMDACCHVLCRIPRMHVLRNTSVLFRPHACIPSVRDVPLGKPKDQETTSLLPRTVTSNARVSVGCVSNELGT